jgi:hypothetical protein
LGKIELSLQHRIFMDFKFKIVPLFFFFPLLSPVRWTLSYRGKDLGVEEKEDSFA